MNDRTTRTSEASTEVELDASDLAAMTPAPKAEPTPAHIPVGELHPDDGIEHTAARSTKVLKIGLPVGLLLAAVATGSALYTRTSPTPAIQPLPPAAPSAPLPDWVTEQADLVPEPQAEPVRFANPFDKSEVFEFPAGTSQAEARDQVAALLLERGLERRATDPKLRKRARITTK
jgi:hypothetical protein